MSILSHAELKTKSYPTPEFLIDPYIPRQSTIFMWGDTSIGKSPLTWHLARSVACGTSFFGLPATLGRVLYLEVDTPERVVVPRLQKLRSPMNDDTWHENLTWVFDESFSVPIMVAAKNDTTTRLGELQDAFEPDLVVINTCRKIHSFDDKDSATPARVYNYFRVMFPQAATLFVHHERKQSRDPESRENAAESFSGSKAWINDAQVGLQLVTFRPKHGKANLRLLHWKSQVSEKVRALEMQLEDDGTNIVCHQFEEYLGVYQLLNTKTERGPEFDKLAAELLSLSERTVRRRRNDIEGGRWPKTRTWLGRSDKEIVEEEEKHDE